MGGLLLAKNSDNMEINTFLYLIFILFFQHPQFRGFLKTGEKRGGILGLLFFVPFGKNKPFLYSYSPKRGADKKLGGEGLTF